MTDQEIFQEIIVPTFEKCAQNTPHFKDVRPELSTQLYGTSQALLDSMGLVAFIFVLEEVLCNKVGTKVEFATDEIIDTSTNYFARVDSLIPLIQKKMGASDAG